MADYEETRKEIQRRRHEMLAIWHEAQARKQTAVKPYDFSCADAALHGLGGWFMLAVTYACYISGLPADVCLVFGGILQGYLFVRGLVALQK